MRRRKKNQSEGKGEATKERGGGLLKEKEKGKKLLERKGGLRQRENFREQDSPRRVPGGKECEEKKEKILGAAKNRK